MGVANAAVWFGTSIFFTFSVGPAFFSDKMIQLLTRPYAGAAAQIIIERYYLMNEICGVIALAHLVAEWLYMGKPLQRLTLWLLLGIAAVGLMGAHSLQPRLKELHRTMYSPGLAPQQIEQAKHSFKVWHGLSQVLNLVVISGVTVYLWRVTTPGSGYRYRA